MDSPLEISRDELRALLDGHYSSNEHVAAIALQSPIFLAQDNSYDITPTMAYDFEGAKVVWVNPLVLDAESKLFACSRIFVFGEAETNILLATARHFAGLISFLTDASSLFEAAKMTADANTRFNLLEIQQAHSVLNSFTALSSGNAIGQLLDVATHPSYTIEEKASLSLAHLYEAAGSLSPYWQYLCYWKVLEVLHGHIRQGGGPLKDYINTREPLNFNQDEWQNNYPDTFARLYGTRLGIAHWQNDFEPEVNDPSNELLRERVEEDLPILFIYMRYSLNPKFGLTAY